MRGDSKNRIIFSLCLMLVVAMLCLQYLVSGVVAGTKSKTTLIVGDSIAYGMAMGKRAGTGVDDAGKVYWVTEGGLTPDFLHPNFKVKLGKRMPRKIVNTLTQNRTFDLLKEVKKNKIEDIVVILGANAPGKASAKTIISCLKKLAKKSGCRIYFVNTLPYVNKGKSKNRAPAMEYYNRLTKEGFKDSGVVYIDAYNLTKSVKNYYIYTWDGIHYSKKVYGAVYKGILDTVKKEKDKTLKLAKKKAKKSKNIKDNVNITRN